MEDLKSILGKAVVLCHQNAYPDCLCSAIALREGLKEINPDLEMEIGAAESFSAASKRILDRSGY